MTTKERTPDSILIAMGFKKGKRLGYPTWLRPSDELSMYDDKKCEPLDTHGLDIEPEVLFSLICSYGINCGKKELALKMRGSLKSFAERTIT